MKNPKDLDRAEIIELLRYLELAHSPINGRYSVTTRVCMWNFEGDRILIALDEGVPGGKPRGWGLLGGGTSNGEIPLAGANREVREEGHLFEDKERGFYVDGISYSIAKMPFSFSSLPASDRKNKGGGPHIELHFLGRVTDEYAALPLVIPIKDPCKHIVEARWVSYDSIPGGAEAQHPDYRYLSDKFYLSHLPIIHNGRYEDIQALEEMADFLEHEKKRLGIKTENFLAGLI